MRATSPTRRPRAAALVAAVATLATLGATATAAAALATSGAAAPSSACTVDYRITSSWSGGFQADVTVTNLGAPRSGWELGWDLPPGEGVSQLWNGCLLYTSPSPRD